MYKLNENQINYFENLLNEYISSLDCNSYTHEEHNRILKNINEVLFILNRYNE